MDLGARALTYDRGAIILIPSSSGMEDVTQEYPSCPRIKIEELATHCTDIATKTCNHPTNDKVNGLVIA